MARLKEQASKQGVIARLYEAARGRNDSFLNMFKDEDEYFKNWKMKKEGVGIDTKYFLESYPGEMPNEVFDAFKNKLDMKPVKVKGKTTYWKVRTGDIKFLTFKLSPTKNGAFRFEVLDNDEEY